ncbi:MAG: hypothetical protein LUB62_00745 [Prevotellaceae bacterium]|nr:hypothetical protein [Prevotellaceae bacterium]
MSIVYFLLYPPPINVDNNKVRWFYPTFIAATVLYVTWFYFAADKQLLMFNEENYLIRESVLILGSFIFLVLFRWTYIKISTTLFSKIIVALGKRSLGVYVISGAITFIVRPYFPEYGFFADFLISVLLTAAFYLLTMLLGKCRLTRKYLLGEK